MRQEFAKLLKQLKKNWADSSLEIVRDAYRVADKAHSGQVRLSGEPYVMHTIMVAQLGSHHNGVGDAAEPFSGQNP